ncbi:MAG: hypothetical protein Q9159_006470 [Coniocarpon cinnabarinum]
MAPSPVVVVCVGMAGSGKTTFMQRINSHLHSKDAPPYVVNLDPAVRKIPFESNIDIRDSVDYKEVMKQYRLGPNGGILTSLNLFATKVDQILAILEKRCKPALETGQSDSAKSMPIENIIIDTPGQIEVFVWSASGQILLSSLASTFPTVLAYVIDTPRTASTSTFMSNMLYACSILYKTKLPMILVFNKTDAQSADFAKDWMTDFDKFQAALKREEETGTCGGAEGTTGGPAVGGSGYMASLLNSMSLVLEEFYKNLSVVGVSSVTGAGVDIFFDAVRDKAQEFERDYKPELERRRQDREKQKTDLREQQLGKMMADMSVEGNSRAQVDNLPRRARKEPETISDMEDEDEDGDEEGVDFDDNGGDQGLTSRYRQAMENNAGSRQDEASFARYIRQSQR